jgi:hypothetical protein
LWIIFSRAAQSRLTLLLCGSVPCLNPRLISRNVVDQEIGRKERVAAIRRCAVLRKIDVLDVSFRCPRILKGIERDISFLLEKIPHVLDKCSDLVKPFACRAGIGRCQDIDLAADKKYVVDVVERDRGICAAFGWWKMGNKNDFCVSAADILSYELRQI